MDWLDKPEKKIVIVLVKAKAMMNPSPPPLGVGWLCELRSLGTSSNFSLKYFSIRVTVSKQMRKLLTERISSKLLGILDYPCEAEKLFETNRKHIYAYYRIG
jgi:hypothetical protein